MKNLIIFGGTGMTGEEAVLYALSQDYKVRLLVRDNKTVPDSIDKTKVELINGDVLNTADVEKALTGQHAVVVVLGTRNCLEPTTMMTQGMDNIIQGMRKLGLKKVSVCLSSFQFMDADKVPKIMQNVNNDHSGMFEVLKSADDIEWRALFPPHIAKEADGVFQIEHEKPVTGCRIVSKRDLGKFLVDSLAQDEHIHKRVGMGTVAPTPA